MPFGIPLPPMPERFDRFESAVHVLKALFSPAAAAEPGVSRPDPFYPLDGATNMPPPLTPGGPPIWLGGQKRRGLALVARHGNGWMLPAIPDFDIRLFQREARRDPGGNGRGRPRSGRLRICGAGPNRDNVREPARSHRRSPGLRPRRRDSHRPGDAGQARARRADRRRPRGGSSRCGRPSGECDAGTRRRRRP